MTSHTKAFGRSLPRDMQEDRAASLTAAGLAHELSPTPLWKVNDHRAGKNGPCQAVYWVKERPVSNDLKRHSSASGASSADERKWDTGAVYKGEWQSNLKHGYGTQIWSNGNKYEGEWANGNREGHGVFWLREKPTPEQKKKMEEKAHAASLISSSSSSAAAAAAAKNTGKQKLRRVYAGNWKNDLKDGQSTSAERSGMSRGRSNDSAMRECKELTLTLPVFPLCLSLCPAPLRSRCLLLSRRQSLRRPVVRGSAQWSRHPLQSERRRVHRCLGPR